MPARTEFKTKIKLAAWERCDGHCEKCGAKLHPGRFQYDHVIPDAIGGSADLDNCQVICSACHDDKTTNEDRPVIDKTRRIRAKHLGIAPKSKAKIAGRGFSKTRDWD